MLYHKIQSVFKRDPATNHKTFLEGEWSEDAFGYLAWNDWLWTEKVDGTNIRVMWDGSSVTLGGRTDRAQIYAPLVKFLQDTFTAERMAEQFPDGGAVLFGEGYGARIQKGGGNYLQDRVGLILFDVVVGPWYLRRESVEEVAAAFGVPVVPIIGAGTLKEAISLVREGFPSECSEVPHVAEGLVMRPLVDLFMRDGSRVITKVKHKDFPE